MKKILALVSFLLLAAACTTQPSTNMSTNSNANIRMSKPAAPSEADMIVKEKAAWDTIKKKDYDAFGNMLASDYTEVEDNGVFDKAGIIADVKDLNLTDATFSDWKMLPIDSDAVILTYQTTLKATYKGSEVPPGPYRSAAVWVNRDGKWLDFYYQQTPVKPPMPAPSASTSPSKTETTTASPAAKPAETGPDPIADEKLVWDAIKSRNYDGFAALLAPDSGAGDLPGDAAGHSEYGTRATHHDLGESQWQMAGAPARGHSRSEASAEIAGDAKHEDVTAVLRGHGSVRSRMSIAAMIDSNPSSRGATHGCRSSGANHIIRAAAL